MALQRQEEEEESGTHQEGGGEVDLAEQAGAQFHRQRMAQWLDFLAGAQPVGIALGDVDGARDSLERSERLGFSPEPALVKAINLLVLRLQERGAVQIISRNPLQLKVLDPSLAQSSSENALLRALSPEGTLPHRRGAAWALREAQAHVRSQAAWRHPYYWAGWVLWGLAD